MVPLNERRKRGRKLRRKIGRGDNADWSLKKTTRDPVAIILAANSDRLRNLVPIKMGRMAAGPFAYFRGAAPLMAADLATLPVTGLQVQICGDPHVRNLGAYAAPEGQPLRNELIVDLVSVGGVFAILSDTWRRGLGGADVERYLHHYQDELPSGKRLEPPNLLSNRFA
jgi:Uncharacterized protein conserved in bacteria (DUF2252)